jgi:hypothetical protein
MNDEQFKEFIKRVGELKVSIDYGTTVIFLALLFIGGCITFHH